MSSPQYTGLVHVIDETELARAIGKRIAAQQSFSDTISVPDRKPEDSELCILSFDHKTLSFFCFARRSRQVVTARCQLNFVCCLDLQDLLPNQFSAASGLEGVLSDLLQKRGGRIPATHWPPLLAELKSLRPASAGEITKLEASRGTSGKAFDEGGYIIVAQEKDATGLALDIFGLKRKDELPVIATEVSAEPAPFLKQLSRAKMLEDTMIANDQNIFPDWHRLKQYNIGAVEFSRGDAHLTILNTNRTPLERTLGVDLVYYHHVFNSFVMVQYKRMEDSSFEWHYRLDAQFDNELKRMQKFVASQPPPDPVPGLADYRLAPEAFFFKFCEAISYSPLESDLIPGMYIPLGYLQMLLGLSRLAGPRSGRVINYSSVERYFNNTMFAQLVQAGWIGSRNTVSRTLIDLVQQSLSWNRSSILAISSSER